MISKRYQIYIRRLAAAMDTFQRLIKISSAGLEILEDPVEPPMTSPPWARKGKL
jgi:hypothetical protein